MGPIRETYAESNYEDEEYLDNANWFKTEEQEVTKTEHIGGTVHEGDLDFEELYGEDEKVPQDSDFEPVTAAGEAEEFENEEANYDDYDDEMLAEFETFDDLEFEKLLD